MGGNVDPNNPDTVTLNDPTSGTYASANAGSGINVSVSGVAIVSVKDNTGATVYGYGLSSSSASGAVGKINPLAVMLTGAKTYDATATAPAAELGIANDLDGANLTLSGIGTSASANAGSESFAAPGTLALGGSAAGNYTLAGIAVNGSAVNVGQLAVVLSGAKTYDATATAPAAELGIGNDLDGANLTLSGIGTLASANAGLRELRARRARWRSGGSAAGQLHARRHRR